jgi:hypothetical protein
MSKYIKNNTLHLGKSEDEIKENMRDVIKYIYRQIPLDHDKMKKHYEHIRVPVSYDDNDDDVEYCNHYRYDLTFVGYYETDDKYIYYFDSKNELNINFYENKEMINELHKFLHNNSPKKIHIGNYDSVTLDNHRGVNTGVRGIRYLDWKLYYWVEFNVYNKSGLTLDDLIIAAYKIRSHKFEDYYETFSEINYMSIDGKSIYINTKFIHES